MIKDMFDPGENLIWEGKPDKAAYVVGPVFLYIIAGVMLFCSLITFGTASAAGAQGNALTVCIFIMVLLLIPALVLGAILPLWRSLNWKHISYAITDRRIYLQKGILGRDITIRDFTDISEPEVSVDFIDKIRNCGSVHLSRRYYVNRSGRKMHTLAPAFLHIPDPYGVFDMVKRMAVDIKSDIYYPNALRNGDNAGYNTDRTAD
jgi:membrane protein YdbS with pleckstrin-like domain